MQTRVSCGSWCPPVAPSVPDFPQLNTLASLLSCLICQKVQGRRPQRGPGEWVGLQGWGSRVTHTGLSLGTLPVHFGQRSGGLWLPYGSPEPTARLSWLRRVFSPQLGKHLCLLEVPPGLVTVSPQLHRW